jgi:hypothetical protein
MLNDEKKVPNSSQDWDLNEVSQVVKKFAIHQASMVLTCLPVQPFVSGLSRLSARVAIENESYPKAIEGIKALPASKIYGILKDGYVRRATSAIPVTSAIIAGGDHLGIDPFLRSVASATIETFLARKSDPKEISELVNSGLGAEEISQRKIIATQNKFSLATVSAYGPGTRGRVTGDRQNRLDLGHEFTRCQRFTNQSLLGLRHIGQRINPHHFVTIGIDQTDAVFR